eukprot:364682-Chlamydomonas_euryale.AAC.7
MKPLRRDMLGFSPVTLGHNPVKFTFLHVGWHGMVGWGQGRAGEPGPCSLPAPLHTALDRLAVSRGSIQSSSRLEEAVVCWCVKALVTAHAWTVLVIAMHELVPSEKCKDLEGSEHA